MQRILHKTRQVVNPVPPHSPEAEVFERDNRVLPSRPHQGNDTQHNKQSRSTPANPDKGQPVRQLITQKNHRNIGQQHPQSGAQNHGSKELILCRQNNGCNLGFISNLRKKKRVSAFDD